MLSGLGELLGVVEAEAAGEEGWDEDGDGGVEGDADFAG